MKKPKIRIVLTIALSVLFIACTIPSLGILNKSDGGIQLLADALKSDDNEPTPFQPFSYTATPTREVEPIMNSLMPNPGLLPPDGQVNILVLGSDWRANSGYRTDVVLLVSIYTHENKVAMVSFPRDLWVTIPGLQEERINTAMGYGGFPLLASTFEYNFAVHVDHYIMTNFQGFVGIIDTLGGIDVEAATNLNDRCDLSYAHGGYCSAGPGTEHMDGEVTLWYVRSRYNTSDFDRTRRAQEVLIAIFKKLMTMEAIENAPQIYNQFINSVETDMTINDMLELINVAPAVLSDTSRIRRYAIGTEHVSPMDTTTGASILEPDRDAIWEIIRDAVYTP